MQPEPHTLQTKPQNHPHCIALVPAAGVGARFAQTANGIAVPDALSAKQDAPLPKQYHTLAGRTVLEHSVAALLAHPAVAQVLVVVQAGDGHAAGLFSGQPRVQVLPLGGPTRSSTVHNGLDYALAHGLVQAQSWVLVHDAARPGLPLDALQRLLEQGWQHPCGALLALPVGDTLKREQKPNPGSNQAPNQAPCQTQTPPPQHRPEVATTVPRDGLWAAQTPQMFRAQALQLALQHAHEQGLTVTDEASAMEAMGQAPLLVQGDWLNLKLTHPHDLLMLNNLMNRTPKHPRVGQGYDVHRLVPGRRLVLGGVEIPASLGLLGHSDADVLLHAITDALLGACALGDIGSHFPDTEASHAGADSAQLLHLVLGKVQQAGFDVQQVDATVVCQDIRLEPHKQAMRSRIASVLGLPLQAVNIKAKTNEGLGYLGRNEAIEAQAVVVVL